MSFSTAKSFKSINLTKIPPGGVLSIKSTCNIEKTSSISSVSSASSIENTTVDTSSLNTNYILPRYATIPDLTSVPTTTTQGAFWKMFEGRDVLTGFGYSTDTPPKEPKFFGGVNTGQINVSMVDITGDVMNTDSRFYIYREQIEDTFLYSYRGAFVKFPISDDDCCSTSSCPPEERVFYKYKAPQDEPIDMNRFSSLLSDVNKLILIFTEMVNGIPEMSAYNVVLRELGYSNRCPATFPVVSPSALSVNVTSNPQKYYYLTYAVRANVFIEKGRVILRGRNINPTMIAFPLLKATDNEGNSILQTETTFPPSVDFRYKTGSNQGLETARLEGYYEGDGISNPTFLESLGRSKVKVTFKDGQQSNISDMTLSPQLNTYTFISTIYASEREFDSSNSRTTDNLIEILMRVPY